MPFQTDRQGALKGEVLARAYKMMTYDAITLGETDLIFGVSYLKDHFSQTDLPVVSLNVSAREEGERVTRPDRDNAETSSAAEEGEQEGDTGPAGAPTDTVGTARLYRDETTPDTGHTYAEPNKHHRDFPHYVLKNVGGVNVAMVGLMNHRVVLPSSVTDSVRISHMEKRLQQLLPQIKEEADLVIALAHCGSSERARLLAAAFDDLDVVVAAHIEPPVPKAERINETVVVYVKGRGRYIGRLDLLLDENKRIIGFDQVTVPVSPSIPNHPGVLRLLAEYIDRLKILVASTAFRPKEKDLKEPATHYITSHACADCHPEQNAHWTETRHAHAFETIDRKQRDFDPDCQRCHTTGFRYRSGFITPRGTPQFKGVQCEACHGPGGTHRDDPTAAYGEITEAVCIVCHTQHNSPEFDYERYLRNVMH